MSDKLQVRIDPVNDMLITNQSNQDIKELQQLSLQYVSQIGSMVSHNEKLVEFMGAKAADASKGSKSSLKKDTKSK